MKVGINKRKAGPIIPSSIDIHCEIQAVPFAQLSLMTFILDTVCLDGKSIAFFIKVNS